MVCIQHPYNSQNIVSSNIFWCCYQEISTSCIALCMFIAHLAGPDTVSVKNSVLMKKRRVLKVVLSTRNSVSSTSGIQLTMMKLSKGNDKRITPIPGPPYQPCVDVWMFLNLVLTSSPKKKADTSEPGSFSSDFFRCTLMATTFRNQCSKQQTVGTWNVATNWIREFVQIWQNNSLGRMTNSSKKNGD